MNLKVRNISSEGRVGKINLEIEGEEFIWDWEFGSEKYIVIVSVPSPREWNDIFKGMRFNRNECLSQIAGEIIKLKCKKCNFKITDNEILFFNQKTG